jgi:hypothetical protein
MENEKKFITPEPLAGCQAFFSPIGWFWGVVERLRFQSMGIFFKGGRHV